MKRCDYMVLNTFTSHDGRLQSNVVLDDGQLFVEYIDNEVLLKTEKCEKNKLFAEDMAENYILGIKKI